MSLHALGSSERKSKKRVGRGGKRGTTSGRGTKGQKSRSGHVIRPAERDLILKIPKHRGFRNKPKTDAAFPVNLDMLSRVLMGRSVNGTVEVTAQVLFEAGVLPKRYPGPIKILSRGEAKFPMTVKGIAISKEAAQKIEKAGGKVVA